MEFQRDTREKQSPRGKLRRIFACTTRSSVAFKSVSHETPSRQSSHSSIFALVIALCTQHIYNKCLMQAAVLVRVIKT